VRSIHIEDNYIEDAWIMVFRDFINNTDHPNYDIPFIDAPETEPYLEKLTAVYEEFPNNQSVDSLFNIFSIKTNSFFPKIVSFGKLNFWTPESNTWIEDFINTGISGVAELDQLMTTY